MDAGRLKDIVSIWRNTRERDEYGDLKEKWVCIGQARAERNVQNSRRALNTGEVWYPRAAVFKIRLGHDVKTGDRIYSKNEYYDVISVTEDTTAEKCITVNTELHNE